MSYYITPDLERLLAHKKGVYAAICREAAERERVANGLLEQAKASTTHVKFDQAHAHETNTSWQQAGDGTDAFFSLNGTSKTSVKSIEFGHMPSGVFDPDVYGETTKPPEGLYILHRAGGLI